MPYLNILDPTSNLSPLPKTNKVSIEPLPPEPTLAIPRRPFQCNNLKLSQHCWFLNKSQQQQQQS